MGKTLSIAVSLLVAILIVLGACTTDLAPTPALTPSSAPAPAPAPKPARAPTLALAPAPASTPMSKPTTPQLVTSDASEMALTIRDFETGWVRDTTESFDKEEAQSAYHAYFYKGKSLHPSAIQSEVAVYPSIELAQQVYLDVVPKNVSVENPKIGDESFLDTSIPVEKRLVFRKSNVVVRLWLQQNPFGDVKPYARIIEKRISTLP